jgi:DNA/RNA-binding protein KIN17
MNATKWVTLTEFVKYLGREGIVRADENEKGWWISWVDNSPKALARQVSLVTCADYVYPLPPTDYTDV